MSISTPNAHYFSSVTSNVEFLVSLVECLCGEHSSITSTTDWQVIDSWDGTTRTAPVSGDLADCANAWVPGGGVPGSGSWIVLQSQPGNVSAVFQVRFKVNSSTPEFYLMPFADWTVGGGTGSSPTIPSRVSPAKTFSVTTGTASRSMVWDEACFAAMTLNSSDATQFQVYCGELNSLLPESSDDRPFVAVSESDGWNAMTSWWRISPVNDTTSLTAGATLDSTANDASAWPLGVALTPVGVYFNASSHQHFAGTARHIAIGPTYTGSTKATCGLSLGVRDWALWRPSGLNASMIRHDGTTLSDDVLRLKTPWDIGEYTVPTISFVTSSPIDRTDSVVVEVTDTEGLAGVVIKIVYSAVEAVAYTSTELFGDYAGSSSISPITNGYQYTLVNDSDEGWYEDFTIEVHAINSNGHTSDSTSSTYVVSDALGFPAEGDEIPPVIDFVTASPIDRADEVVIDVTDELALGDVVINAAYIDGSHTVYTVLGFTDRYATSSTVTPISGGKRFTLINTDGWYSDVEFTVRANNRFRTPTDGGSAYTEDSFTYEVTDGLGFPESIIPGEDPDITWVTAAGTIPAANSVTVDVTDDIDLEDATIWVTYGSLKHIIYSRNEFSSIYSTSSTSSISGGTRFILANDIGWYDDFTLNVLAIDTYGNETTANRSWTVTDGPGLPLDEDPGDPPDIEFSGSSSISASGSINFTVTDDGTLGSVTVWAEFDGLCELIYTSEGFTGNYGNDSTFVPTSSSEWSFSLISETGWYDDLRLWVLATDSTGQSSSESRLYDVTGGPGVPTLPSGAPDTDNPVVSNVEPSSLASLRKLDPISFTVTDNSGAFLTTFITIEYANGVNELVYDGRFSAYYAAASSRTPTTNGYVYRLKRAGGWPSSPKLQVIAYDRSTNPIRLQVT